MFTCLFDFPITIGSSKCQQGGEAVARAHLCPGLRAMSMLWSHLPVSAPLRPGKEWTPCLFKGLSPWSLRAAVVDDAVHSNIGDTIWLDFNNYIARLSSVTLVHWFVHAWVCIMLCRSFFFWAELVFVFLWYQKIHLAGRFDPYSQKQWKNTD